MSALCKGVGERLVYDSSTSSKEIEEEEEEEEEKGRKASIAVEWLLEAVKLVENRTTSQIAKSIQISALKSLAQAYLNLTPVKSGWVKAEAVVSELLVCLVISVFRSGIFCLIFFDCTVTRIFCETTSSFHQTSNGKRRIRF